MKGTIDVVEEAKVGLDADGDRMSLVLLDSTVGVDVLTGVDVLEAAPAVPEGSLLSLMYPYRPEFLSPQRSEGYPGHFSEHEPVSC